MVLGDRRAQFWIDVGPDHHIQDIEARQQKSREDCAHEHLADGESRLGSIHDQHDAGRYENAQGSRCYDYSRSQSLVITAFDHRSERHERQDGYRRRDDTEAGGEDRAEDDGDDGQSAPDPAERVVETRVQVVGDPRILQHDPHEGKQGDGEVRIVQGQIIEPGEQDVKGSVRSENQYAYQKSDAADDEGDGKSGHDQDKHAAQHQQGDKFRRQLNQLIAPLPDTRHRV